MTLAESISLCEQLRKEYALQDDVKTEKTLSTLKVQLASLNILFPPSSNEKELLLARESLEIGALLSIKQQQVDSFERYIIQLKTFYSQKYLILTRPESPRMYMLLGLNLLRLLAQGKYSEFHVELESIPSKELKNIYINHPLMIEQSLMEGSYSKIYTTLHDVPAQEYNFFMNILQKTIRFEIQKSAEKAYASLPLQDAITLLYFKTQQELLSFCDKVGWKVDLLQKRVFFHSDKKAANEIPVERVIHNVLDYAQELERIV